VEAEWVFRENRKLKRNLRTAKLRLSQACLEDLNTDPRRKLDRDLIRRLGTGRWVLEHRNVIITGATGTGKTFLSLAAALEQVVEMGRYRRVSVYRPLIAVGRQEVGFLPGDLADKLEPWMAAVHDNLYALFGGDGGSPRDAVDELFDRDLLELAAITYLRGRSITGELVIVDEAQNLELSTLKVILTRMGENSKVVFCGDLSQVDNPYISPFGGLAALIEKFKGNPMFGHITMERTVRSPLAELATQLL
jgi:PhoH-like ATPase